MNTRARRGFGLIELMVALAISSLLLIGITQLFISSKDNYRVIEGVSRLQENARFVIDTLSRDLRHSGLYGCRSGVAMWGLGQTARFENPVPPVFQTDFDGGNALEGFDVDAYNDSTWTPAVPAGAIAGATLDGNDILVIRGSLGAGKRVNNAPAAGPIQMELGEAAGFVANELLLITNCDGATLFTASAVNLGTDVITSGQNLGQVFDNTSEVYKARTIVYFIRDSNGISSLFRREFNDASGVAGANPAQELVAGVQNMQILYGVDGALGALDNVADAYLRADQVAAGEMNNVVSLRIGLLMVTPEGVRRQAETTPDTPVLGVNIPPRDGRSLHQLVVSTITLRNRAFPQ